MNGKDTIQIIIAAHKPYRMPQDEIYLPLQVGAAGKDSIGFQRDDTGENISHQNAHYCELTGLYWAWKNLNCEYLGLAHYRRHFSAEKGKDAWESVLEGRQLRPVLRKYDVILPKRRNYYIETISSHYGHTFDPKHLEVTRQVIAQQTPEYLNAFDAVMNSRGAHMFNMFVMKKELADGYCQWLFQILAQVEQAFDYAAMTDFEARYLGRISELLLDVYVQKHQLRYQELDFIYMEPVNWGKKISSFLLAKFTGKKYQKSF